MVLNQSPGRVGEKQLTEWGRRKQKRRRVPSWQASKRTKPALYPKGRHSHHRKKPPRKIEKPKRGRKAYFSQEEIRILQRIVEKRRRLDKHLTRPIIARLFEEDMMKHFRKLCKVTQPGDVVYLDNAAINQDTHFHSIEAFFGRKQVYVSASEFNTPLISARSATIC